jgi:hypothetical protein
VLELGLGLGLDLVFIVLSASQFKPIYYPNSYPNPNQEYHVSKLKLMMEKIQIIPTILVSK